MLKIKFYSLNIIALICCFLFSMAAFAKSSPSVYILGDGFSLGFWSESKHILDSEYLNSYFSRAKISPLPNNLIQQDFNWWVSPGQQVLEKAWVNVQAKYFAQLQNTWVNQSSELNKSDTYYFAWPHATIQKSLLNQLNSVKQRITNKENERPVNLKVFFNGLDICQSEVQANFRTTLRAKINQFLARSANILPRGSTLTWVGPAMITSGLYHENLLDKNINVIKDGKHLKCRHFWGKAPAKDSKETPVQINPKFNVFETASSPLQFCKIFKIAVNNEERLSFLANRIQFMRQSIVDGIEEMQSLFNEKGISLVYNNKLENFVPEPDELANNCFHYSKLGQLALMKSLSY